MPSLGIDIGGSSVKAVYEDGGTLTTARSAGYTRPSRDELVAAVREALRLLDAAVDESTPIGLCLPGKQSVAGDRVERSINLPSLDGWLFSAFLGSVLGFNPDRYRVVSDVHATAIDIVSRYELAGRVAVIAMGTGVGFAMLEDGEVLRLGSRGAGHLGQLDVGRCDEHDRFHADGARNTLESYVGVHGLREQLGTNDELMIEDYLRHVSADDPVMRALVHAMRVVHAIHTPDTIVLVGGVGVALRPGRDLIHQLVSDGLTSLARPGWELQFGDSLYHAASGAARLALR
ncbi:MAG: ROK family protein [Phycisphaerales bacterium]